MQRVNFELDDARCTDSCRRRPCLYISRTHVDSSVFDSCIILEQFTLLEDYFEHYSIKCGLCLLIS